MLIKQAQSEKIEVNVKHKLINRLKKEIHKIKVYPRRH